MVMDSRHRKPLQRAMMGGVVGNTLIKFSEWVTIQNGIHADLTIGYPTTAAFFKDSGGGEARGIVKLARSITANDPKFTHISLGPMLNWSHAALNNNAASLLGFRIDTYKITQDFDASAVTWNNYGALAKTQLPTTAYWQIEGDDNCAATSAGGGVGELSGQDIDIKGTDVNESWDLTGTYAFGIHVVDTNTASAAESWLASFNLRVETGKPEGGFVLGGEFSESGVP